MIRPLAALASLALAACAPKPGPAERPRAAAPVAANPDAGAGDAFHCFAWVHLEEFSTDCYRTEAQCAEARRAMQAGARDPAPCGTQARASCTTLTNRGGGERCFGDAGRCGNYRQFVARNGLTTSDCAER